MCYSIITQGHTARQQKEKKMNALEKIKQNLKNQSVAVLKQWAIDLSVRFDDGADLVFEEVINVLESKMEKEDFIAFCEAL